MTTENFMQILSQVNHADELILVTSKRKGVNKADIQFTFIGPPVMTNNMEALEGLITLFMKHLETIEAQKQKTTT